MLVKRIDGVKRGGEICTIIIEQREDLVGWVCIIGDWIDECVHFCDELKRCELDVEVEDILKYDIEVEDVRKIQFMRVDLCNDDEV